MAFFDFLSQGVGGTTPAVTEPGVMGEGDVVTSAAKPIGPTYNDIAKAAMVYGSKRGSSAPMMSSLIPSSGWEGNIQPLVAPKLPANAITKEDSSDASLGAIGKWLGTLFGIGA